MLCLKLPIHTRGSLCSGTYEYIGSDDDDKIYSAIIMNSNAIIAHWFINLSITINHIFCECEPCFCHNHILPYFATAKTSSLHLVLVY